MAEQSTVLLILGMHRSGTSALTRVLNLCGVDLGTRLMPPAADNNQHGFWEHLDAVDVDERLLHHLGRSWWDTRSLPQGWLHAPGTASLRPRIGALVRDEFSGSPLWALKDPRLCRLLPLWLEELKAAGVQVKLVFMLRHPEEVTASLARRDGISAAESGTLLLLHFFEAALASAGLPRSVVTYQALMDDWRGCVGRIARELDIALPLSEAVEAEVERFLSPSARHHHAAGQSPALSGSLNGRVYRLACESGDSAAFWAGTEELLRVWRMYQQDFVPYVNELQDMLAIRAAMERREAKPLSAAGGGDTLSMTPLTHLQFRMITGLQDGVGRLGQAAADVAATVVQVGTESAAGLSGQIATAVTAVHESLGSLRQDLGQVSAALENGLQQLAGQAAREQALEARLAALQQENAGSAASQERGLAALKQQLDGAAELAAARQEQLGTLLATAVQRLEAMELREQQREDRRLGRRLRRLLSGK